MYNVRQGDGGEVARTYHGGGKHAPEALQERWILALCLWRVQFMSDQDHEAQEVGEDKENKITSIMNKLFEELFSC